MNTNCFYCKICNREFKKQKDFNNHNKAKHPIEINKTIKLKLIEDENGFKFKPDIEASFEKSFVHRFTRLKYYLKYYFENNLEIYLVLKLKNTDARILRPVNNSENTLLNTDYLGFKSPDILIIQSIIKCLSSVIRPSQSCPNADIIICEKYIPDIDVYNPFKNILEIYTIELNKNIHKLSKNNMIHYKKVFAYNVFYINLPRDILSYILKYLEIVDYKKTKKNLLMMYL